MPTLSFEQSLRLAATHYQAGNLAGAESLCRQILAAEPRQPDALNILALIAHRTGRSDDAIGLLRNAIAVDPSVADYHANLGLVLATQRKLDEAIPPLQTSLRLQPDHADARHTLGNVLFLRGDYARAATEFETALKHNPHMPGAAHNLGNALMALNRLDEAVAAFRQAISLQPGFAQAYLDLGIALRRQGKLEPAAAALCGSIRIKPDSPDAYVNLAQVFTLQHRRDDAIKTLRQGVQSNQNSAELYVALGNALREMSSIADAEACYRAAIRLQPVLAEAYINLGSLLRTQGKLAEARSTLARAIQLKPDSAEAHNNLGNTLRDQSNFDEATAAYQNALRINPHLVQAMSNLGGLLKDQGNLDQAIAHFREAIAREPEFVDAYCNYLYTIQFHPDYDSQRICDEHRKWGRRFGISARQQPATHTNDRNPDRRIRVGYVSPNFREHAVGRFLLPLLRKHDHARHEIICYSDTESPDHLTGEIRACTDQWHHTAGLANAELAELIRSHRVDVLVDLTLHMAQSRLMAFARKPAPVQLTWLGYAGTSGLDAIDYRLTDPYLDPPGMNDEFYSERSIHLPRCYWCYEAPSRTPELDPLPAIAAGYITFGCLNNFCKISNQTLTVWMKLLRNVPESRMILHAHEGSHRRRVNQILAASGIDPKRVSFVGVKPLREYLSQYGQSIDIALDPFPYNGGTTTCDALWMGVPVVSLAGQRAVSRAGVTLLNNVGLPELVASTQEQYVEIAEQLASDLPRLIELRTNLRPRMQASPLMDALRFAADIEAVYRRVWSLWCDRQKA